MRFSKAIFSSLLITLLLVSACSRDGANTADKQNALNQAQAPGDLGLIRAIKNGKLLNFEKTSIGNAFDSYSYLTKKEWKERRLAKQPLTVDFIGWFSSDTLTDKDIKEGIAGRGLDAKFVINTDGSFYLFTISVLDATRDGGLTRERMLDIDATLKSIYANKKITL